MIKIIDITQPPAYTDMTNIYISYKLNPKDREVAIFHEQGHIRLKHYTRGLNINVKDFKLWNVACDIEISAILYPIYDYNNYIKNLTKRSLLYGGITFPLDDFENITEDMTAEEIYEILSKKQDSQLQYLLNQVGEEFQKGLGSIEGIDKETETEINIKDLIQNIKATSKKQAEKDKEQQKSSEQFFELIKPKPQKLSTSTEKELRKLKNTTIFNKKSYTKPNRRKQCQECSKGLKVVLKPAKVVVFVDCSGSFDETKTKNAEDALYEIEQQFRGALKFNKFFFSDKVGKDRKLIEGGGTNYQQVFREIKNISPALTIIITDNDNCNKPLVDLTGLNIKIEVIGCNYEDAPITKWF